MMKLTPLSLLILLLSQAPLSLSTRCNPKDKQALLKIKAAFNNAYDFKSWDPATDCCSWYIVDCDRQTNRIIKFRLTYTNISAQIPHAIADLPFLQSLTFTKIPNLTGSIPPAIARLTNLQSLTISWTNLSGQIPPFLSQLKALTYLDLSFNNFGGSIPPSLASLRNLTGLRLDRNKLTGPIPDSFGKLPAGFQYLVLSHNQLSGTLPRGWGDLNFTTVQLDRNRLEGGVTALFGKNKSIENADLSRNLLQFDMSSVEFPESLNYLDLNHNVISGSLPAELAALTFLNVSYNRLCGRIPTGGVMQEMDYSSFFHNRCLCGAPLPDCK